MSQVTITDPIPIVIMPAKRSATWNWSRLIASILSLLFHACVWKCIDSAVADVTGWPVDGLALYQVLAFLVFVRWFVPTRPSPWVAIDESEWTGLR